CSKWMTRHSDKAFVGGPARERIAVQIRRSRRLLLPGHPVYQPLFDGPSGYKANRNLIFRKGSLILTSGLPEVGCLQYRLRCVLVSTHVQLMSGHPCSYQLYFSACASTAPEMGCVGLPLWRARSSYSPVNEAENSSSATVSDIAAGRFQTARRFRRDPSV